jgi:hypothetical protein
MTAVCDELQWQSGSEGGVGRPEATHPEVLGSVWGQESVPVASHKERWRLTDGPQ